MTYVFRTMEDKVLFLSSKLGTSSISVLHGRNPKACTNWNMHAGLRPAGRLIANASTNYSTSYKYLLFNSMSLQKVEAKTFYYRFMDVKVIINRLSATWV